MTSIDAKLDRAHKHINDLAAAITEFLATHPYRTAFYDDPQTGKRQLQLFFAAETPASILAIGGDVLNNLRSALDHLAWQLIKAGGNTPGAHTGFPIFDAAPKYVAGAKGKIGGARPDAIKAIDAIQPYQGGNGDALWRLHALNNIDKHRDLVTVGATIANARFSQHALAGSMAPLGAGAAGGAVDLTVKAPFLLKEGDEFSIEGVPDSQINENVEIACTIALAEPGIVQGKPLSEALEEMFNFTDGVVTTLKPYL